VRALHSEYCVKKMTSSSIIEIEKFNGQSFDLWKIKLEDLIVDREQWIVVGSWKKPISMSKEVGKVWKKVRSMI
jgi:hypothetical protein